MEEKYYQLEIGKKSANLYIFGQITSYPWQEKEKDAYIIVKELSDIDVDQINVHINSMGGSVAEGLAIYNTLKNHKASVTTFCDGFACSAASVVFMAGDKRIMNEASLLMIHNAWTCGIGNASELRKQADDLETITQASVNAYIRNSTISEEEIKKMMDEETWISADKAKEYGFATHIYEEDNSGIKQSAMVLVRNKLLEKKVVEPLQDSGPDAKEIAMEVAKILKEEKVKKAVPTKNEWDKFFS